MAIVASFIYKGHCDKHMDPVPYPWNCKGTMA